MMLRYVLQLSSSDMVNLLAMCIFSCSILSLATVPKSRKSLTCQRYVENELCVLARLQSAPTSVLQIFLVYGMGLFFQYT